MRMTASWFGFPRDPPDTRLWRDVQRPLASSASDRRHPLSSRNRRAPCIGLSTGRQNREDEKGGGINRFTLDREIPIQGLLLCQGVSGYEALRRDRRQRLDELKTGDGRALPDHLKAQISRDLARLELLLEQIKAMEAERDALFAAAKATMPASGPVAMLLEIKGIGPEFAAILWMEAFFRSFAN